jgi:hypothetical protein
MASPLCLQQPKSERVQRNDAKGQEKTSPPFAQLCNRCN